MPIIKKGGDEASVMAAISRLADAAQAAGIRTKIDADQTKSPGFRFNYWELKVCLRIASLGMAISISERLS